MNLNQLKRLVEKRLRQPKKSQYRPTSVKCYGCERESSGGAPCWDHKKSPAQFIWQPQKRWCVRCRKNEAPSSGDVCNLCLAQEMDKQRQDIMRQQMMQLHQALSQVPYQNPPVGNFYGVGITQQLANAQLATNLGVQGKYEQYRDRAVIAKTEAEVVVGPILAFRVWKLGRIGYWLESAGNGAKIWKAKEPMTGDVTIHGVYAWREIKPNLCGYALNGNVIGGVWLWGDVIEHEDGYRASHGYPAFLWKLRENFSTHNVQHRLDTQDYVCLRCGKSVTYNEVNCYSGQIDPLAALLGPRCITSNNTPTDALGQLYGIPVVEIESWNDLIVPDKETLLFEEE